MKEIQEICDKLCDLLNIDKNKVKVIDRGCPHKSSSCVLLKNYSAVYMFRYNNQYLKIGKVGVNSNARFQYQHYSFNANDSTLARSLINDKNFEYILKDVAVKEWMEENLYRIDIMFHKSLGKHINSVFESVLHYIFNPRYEGRNYKDF